MIYRSYSIFSGAGLAIAACLMLVEAAQAQTKSKPPIPIRGCVTYVKMSDAQAKSINDDLAHIANIRNEREAKLTEARLMALREEELRLREEEIKTLEQRARAEAQDQRAITPSLSAPSVAVHSVSLPPAQVAAYEDEIIKIGVGLESKRKLLAEIDRAYRKCLEKPPQSAEAATPAAAKAKPAKRTVSAPREQNLRAATPPPARGGHDPAASAVVGGVVGGVIRGLR
jgi:hypothetical protein